MRSFATSLKPSAVIMILMTVLLGIVYPLFMWGVGQFIFHREANGALVFNQDGKINGSDWIAQNFTKPAYFHPRPSSAGPQGYDAANSSGSNLGPTSQKLVDALKQRAASYRAENRLAPNTMIPADAVTTSGSGLDPHISVENALIQAPRVAKARKMAEQDVRDLIDAHTEGRTWWIYGEPRVNVLKLNLALDKRK